MGGTTAQDAIPYMTATDALAGLDEFTLSLATRLQALENMRQGGEASITPSAANTATTKRITFPESIPGGGTPKVVVCLAENAGAGAVTLWVTGIDATGFTLGINSTNTTARAVKWMAIP